MIDKRQNILRTGWVLGTLIIVAWYIYLWFNTPGSFHIENYLDIPHFVSGGMHGIKDAVCKSFDLNMIEGGYYRPRWLAFLYSILTRNIGSH